MPHDCDHLVIISQSDSTVPARSLPELEDEAMTPRGLRGKRATDLPFQERSDIARRVQRGPEDETSIFVILSGEIRVDVRGVAFTSSADGSLDDAQIEDYFAKREELSPRAASRSSRGSPGNTEASASPGVSSPSRPRVIHRLLASGDAFGAAELAGIRAVATEPSKVLRLSQDRVRGVIARHYIGSRADVSPSKKSKSPRGG